jgi:hypothetical protein
VRGDSSTIHRRLEFLPESFGPVEWANDASLQKGVVMTGDEGRSRPETIVYIDYSDIRDGKVNEIRAGVLELVAFVEAHEPQLIAYGFYVDEEADQMTVVAVHPDSASLELHMEAGGPEFRKLAHLISLRSIEVYGRVSNRALQMLEEKAARLGDGGRVVVREPYAGFRRVLPPRRSEGV